MACIRFETIMNEVMRVATEVQKDQIKLINKNIELESRIKELESIIIR